jgi:hypothetical protein
MWGGEMGTRRREGTKKRGERWGGVCRRAGRGEGRWAHEDAKARRRGEREGEGEG